MKKIFIILIAIFNICIPDKTYSLKRSIGIYSDSTFNLLKSYSPFDTIDISISNYQAIKFPTEALDLNYSKINLNNVSNSVLFDFILNIKNKSTVKEIEIIRSPFENYYFISLFQNLEVLILTDVNIKIKDIVTPDSKLKILELNNCRIEIDSISKFNNLEFLKLRQCSSVSNIDEIIQLNKLKSLEIREVFIWDNNTLQISKLKELEELYLIKNGISNIDLNMSENLKVIVINENPLINFEDLLNNIKNISKIEGLSISGNSIRKVPSLVYKMINLKELYLCNNHLEFISNELKNLEKIEGLFLENNDIQILPDNINELKNLKFLSIRYNKFQDLNFLNNSNKLQIIQIEGNPINKNEIERFKENNLKINLIQ